MMKEDYYFSQCSELWDFLREKRHYKAPGDTSAAWHGDPTGMTCTFSRENFKKGIPKHYGATLQHSETCEREINLPRLIGMAWKTPVGCLEYSTSAVKKGDLLRACTPRRMLRCSSMKSS